MSNLDTTTPISEFNVVDENGNTTVIPLSAGSSADNIYVAEAQLIINEDNTFTLGEHNIDYETLNNGILDGTYQTAIIKLLGDTGYSYCNLIMDLAVINEQVGVNGYAFLGYYGVPDGKSYEMGIMVQASQISLTATEKSSGKKLYQHNIYNSVGTSLQIINTSDEMFTYDTLKQYFIDNGLTNDSSTYQCVTNPRIVGDMFGYGNAMYFNESENTFYTWYKYVKYEIDFDNKTFSYSTTRWMSEISDFKNAALTDTIIEIS